MNTGKYICLLGLLFALLSPLPSLAGITFIVTADGDKGFIIEGDDITPTAHVEITVVYDSTMLKNPRVSVRGGTVADIMDSNPGTLIFDAVQGDDPGPSFVANLGFDRMGDSQGGIFSVTGKIMEQDGTISPSRTMANATTPSLLTWVSNDGETENSVATEETAISGIGPELMKAEKSVVQRFREFRGERGLKAFVALFERGPHDMLVQEPPVALSDGKTPVRITLPLQLEDGDSPNVALSDAQLVHLEKEGDKGWVITALPNEGTWSASLLIKVDEKIIELPLVVAPPVKIHKGITERNFVAELDWFISDQVRAGKGEKDPLRHVPYEYVFTANYLASYGNATVRTTPEQAKLVSNSKNNE
ncbi:MAG: hypothetical protein ABSA06_09625 [Geobacteraceae bacterium]|jgi:hypothetical protein